MAKYSIKQIVTLIIISFVNTCSAICFSLQAPFYPAEAESKGATATQYGLVFGIFQLAVFVISPIYGQYISQIGPKFMFNAGIYTTGSTCILFGFLNYINEAEKFITMSFLVRIVEALGSAGFQQASFAIIANEFPEHVGTAFATIEAAFGAGIIIGPTVGGALYEVGGFTLPFVSMGILLLIAAMLTSIVLPSRVTQSVGNAANFRVLIIITL